MKFSASRWICYLLCMFHFGSFYKLNESNEINQRALFAWLSKYCSWSYIMLQTLIELMFKIQATLNVNILNAINKLIIKIKSNDFYLISKSVDN